MHSDQYSERLCLYCEKSFKPRQPQCGSPQLYCSVRCQKAQDNRKRRVALEQTERPCSHCEQPFTPGKFQPNQLYCSKKCSKSVQYAKLMRQTAEDKLTVISIYSGGTMSCAICPENRIELLDVDHIDGDGGWSDGADRSPRRWTTRLKEADLLKYRVLCRNHNRLEDHRRRGVGMFDGDPLWEKAVAWAKAGCVGQCSWKLLESIPTIAPDGYRLCTSCALPIPVIESRSATRYFCNSCNNRKVKWETRLLRLKLLASYSDCELTCSLCGTDEITVLDVDHIEGDGRNERKTFASVIKRYGEYLRAKDTNKYRILCQNCNYLAYLARCPTT